MPILTGLDVEQLRRHTERPYHYIKLPPGVGVKNGLLGKQPLTDEHARGKSIQR